MFIPNFLLHQKKDSNSQNSEIPLETIQNHQNLLKIYNSGINQINKNIKPDELQSKIYDWIFSKEYDDITALFTLDNNYSTKFIYYLYKKAFSNSKITLQIVKTEYEKLHFRNNSIEESGKLYDLRDIKKYFMPSLSAAFHKTVYEKMEKVRRGQLDEEIETILIEHENKEINYGTFDSVEKYSHNDKLLISFIIIQSIQFFNLYNLNDGCTLNYVLLSEKIKLKEYFDLFSNNKCFKYFPKCHSYPTETKNEKIYNLDFCEWFDVNKPHYLGSIIVAIFEQSIMIKFAISQLKNINNISRFTSNLIISSKVADFYIKRKNVLNYMVSKFNENNAEQQFEKVRFFDFLSFYFSLSLLKNAN